jgi:hypothetical protein
MLLDFIILIILGEEYTFINFTIHLILKWCSKQGRQMMRGHAESIREIVINIFWIENLKRRKLLKYVDVDWRILLKRS